MKKLTYYNMVTAALSCAAYGRDRLINRYYRDTVNYRNEAPAKIALEHMFNNSNLYIRDYCTVAIECGRQVGKTSAAAMLSKENSSTVILVSDHKDSNLLKVRGVNPEQIIYYPSSDYLLRNTEKVIKSELVIFDDAYRFTKGQIDYVHNLFEYPLNTLFLHLGVYPYG